MQRGGSPYQDEAKPKILIGRYRLQKNMALVPTSVGFCCFFVLKKLTLLVCEEQRQGFPYQDEAKIKV